jgi:hypothetical protein
MYNVAYPYDGIDFVGAKKKTSVGLSVNNSSMVIKSIVILPGLIKYCGIADFELWK